MEKYTNIQGIMYASLFAIEMHTLAKDILYQHNLGIHSQFQCCQYAPNKIKFGMFAQARRQTDTCHRSIMSRDSPSCSFVVLSHYVSFHYESQASPPGADVFKTNNSSHSEPLTADRQPSQTCHSISFAGSWSHGKQCTHTLTHTHTAHTCTHTYGDTPHTNTILMKG